MSWKNIQLGEVLKHRKGSITIADDKEYKLCRVRLHRKGVLLREYKKGSEIKTKKQQLCKPNDFIVAEMDAKVGGYGFIPEELDGAIVSSHYYLFELDPTKIKREFLDVICQTTILQEQIKATGSTNYAAIRPGDVLAWKIKLPPLQKQNQIAKIILSTKASVSEITTELSRQLELVRQLRQAFLREAMQGQLVPQDETDESAKVLLERIKAEKEKLVAEKKIKRDKPLPAIAEEEIPFEISENWVWCRLGEIVSSTSGGTPDRGNPDYWKGKISWLKSGELNDDLITHDSEEKISEAGLKNSSAKLFPKGTLLIALYGATAGKLGILDFDSTTNQAICGLLENPFIVTKFLFYFLMNWRKKIVADSWGQAQPNISQTYLKSFHFSLPPLPEQTRIVAKLEKLMAYCDSLETSIRESASHAENLLQVALKEALAPPS